MTDAGSQGNESTTFWGQSGRHPAPNNESGCESRITFGRDFDLGRGLHSLSTV